MLAMKRRNLGGAQPRRATVRLFARIDRALASRDGLSMSHFCEDNECSDETVRRYLLELMSSGKRIGQELGVWRYAVDEERLFTDAGYAMFHQY